MSARDTADVSADASSDVSTDAASGPSDERLDPAFPAGFAAHTGHLGLRDEGDDLAVVVTDAPAACAALFTRSRFAGASVLLSRPRAATGSARGFVVVAKNANVATGPRGERNALEVTELAGAATGVPGEQLLIASTGVIGRQYPMAAMREYFAAPGGLALDATPRDVATAIMTTDSHPKLATATVGAATVVGFAKGVGMIEPDMATMLAYVLTDADVDAATLERVWRPAVDASFNCLSIDTDTSTSDSAILLASGAAGPVDEAELAGALARVCLDLTLQLARDGEGATKLITVEVTGARDAAQAKRVAKTVLNSPLVKTAVHGADPNWGRVAMAIGKCSEDTDIDQHAVTIGFGDLQLYPETDAGNDTEARLDRLREIMSADDVTIRIGLGLSDPAGPHRARVYGCDLTEEYVRFNSEYTT